jgi:hypothetical protein
VPRAGGESVVFPMSTLTDVRPAAPPARAALAPLARQLTAADRVLQREKGASLVLRAWPWVLGYILAAFALDVLLHFAAGPRVALLAGFGLLVIGVLAAGAYLAWIRRNSFEHTARVLESRDPRLGSKLINVLQLQAQTEDRAVAPLTRELAGMAIEGYTDELRGENLPRLARTDRLKSDARRLAYGSGGFLAVLAAFFSITRTELPRFLDPFGDHPPYSFTQLEITEPGNDAGAVVYGQNIVITARSHGHRPGELFLTSFAPENPAVRTTVPMFDKGDRGFTQQIEGIKTNLVVFAHTRNGHSLSKQRRIAVILTPKLERASVKIEPPAYTGLAPDERSLQFKSLKALEGSTLTFRLASNRPLASGRISVANESGAIQPVLMEASGEREVVASIVAKESAQLKFSITDRDGFDSQETWSLALSVTHDLPPDVHITNPDSDAFVAMDFKAEPVIEAADDYGLKTVRIHQARNGVFVEPRTIDYDKPPLNAREGLTFDFRNMDVASGDEISIFAEAIDNAPEPHLVRSKTLTLTVISTEEYNQFLREQMDLGDIEAKYAKLLNEFHDLVDQQKKLGDDIDALKKQLEAAQTDTEKAALQKKLDELLAKQEQLNQRLNQLASTMENFVRDQPLYDIEADLKNTLAEKAQEIRDSTKANDEKVKELAAQLPQPPAPQPPGAEGATPPPKDPAAGNGQAGLSQKMLNDFKQASDEQLEKLGAVEKEAQEQVMQPLADLSLMHEIVKDINRFKELYEAQKQLAEQARAYDRPGPLSREDQLALKNMAALENEIGAQLDAVEQKLWEDGKAAEGKFPKAGQSAQHLAQQMGDLRLQSLAHKATGAMLEGKGDQGAQLAENLRSEMDKLFCQCNSKGGQMNDELDHYLSIQRSMKPANNFKQMMQTRKFGQGSKTGPMGSGKGRGGKDGYAVITGPNANVMGGETPITETDKAKTDGPGRNKAKPDAASAAASIDKEDVVHGVEPINRESGAVQGEAGIEQYREIVDKYFKAITKPAAPKAPPKKP